MLTGLVSSEASFLGLQVVSWPSSPYIFMRFSLCVLISSSYKDTGQTGLMPILKASFNLNYLFKDCLQIQSNFEALGIRTLLTKIINKESIIRIDNCSI